MASVAIQFLLYACVGAIACIVDVGIFSLLIYKGQFQPLASTSFSFTVATFVNYCLSTKFVFAQNRNHFSQILRTFLVSGIGLILNGLGLSLTLHLVPFSPVFAKLLVIPIVLFWNFWGRRTFVYSSATSS